MIELRMINGTPIVLNSDLIESIEATPDTVISLTTGKKVMVKETVPEVIDKVVEFRRRLGASPAEEALSPAPPGAGDNPETDSHGRTP